MNTYVKSIIDLITIIVLPPTLMLLYKHYRGLWWRNMEYEPIPCLSVLSDEYAAMPDYVFIDAGLFYENWHRLLVLFWTCVPIVSIAVLYYVMKSMALLYIIFLDILIR